MSSRGNFLGTGPASGVYTPKPTPQLPEDMPIYINDELLDLGGRLNNILEGGAFPPQSQLPKRVKDGMMIYFTMPVDNSQISSAGVWLYRKEKWWKVIDDPSAISQNLTVYKKFKKGSTRPPKPPINKYLVEDLNGWNYVPESNDDANDQWMSVAVWAVTDPDNPIVDWAEPIMFNTEGTSGQPGSDGYSIEFRYIASTLKPSIKDRLNKTPVTNEDKAYVTSIPPVTHPNENFVWQIQTYIRNDQLGEPWSDPVKFSTPDTTKSNTCYNAAKEGYDTFNQSAAGLPGPKWQYSVPSNIPEGWNLWRSERLEWSDGSPQTTWSIPYKANGQVGAKQETRYTASTEAPVIVNDKSREPVGSKGEVFSTALPNTSHPDKSFLWVTTGVINRLNEVEIAWTEPAKYGTPDTTNSVKCFAKGTLNSFPTFTPNAPNLPGDGWSREFPGNLSPGDYIWESGRLEWSDGTAQGNWTAPVRTTGYDGTDGTSMEHRYRASTTQPSISTGDRNPANWTTSVPNVSHPNNSIIWVSYARINSKDELIINWSVPAKYATPDSITYKYAYGLGTPETYPNFNPSASGLPGSSWAYEPQKPQRGQRVWVTGRYQWNDSTGTTSWAPPTLFSGADGNDGYNGNDGFTLVEIYQNATTKPPEIPDAERKYPPDGWDKEQETPPMGQVTWSSKNYVRGKVEEATTTIYNYSGVVQLSGSDGTNGVPGVDGKPGASGTTYYTWIMYADTSTGGGISGSPVGKKYVGFAYNQKVSTPSMNEFDYVWYLLEGSQGIPGKPGADGTTTYTWVKYADNDQGKGMSDSPLNKEWLGLAFNKIEQQESEIYTDYQWSKIHGDQGIAGVPGEDGVTFYTWVKYADNKEGDGMSDVPDDKTWLGLAYNKLDQKESEDPKLYTWSLIKGFDGMDGVPGLPGKDGITLYTWIKYADNAAGDGMSDLPAGKDYIGIAHNKTTATESTTKTDYTWSKVHGDQGIAGSPGADGKTYYTWVKYGDNAQGGGISDSPVGKEWLGLAYNKEVQQESSTPADYTWSKIHGDQGIEGEPGIDGITYYTWIKYANDASGTGISDSPTGKSYMGLAYNQKVQQESLDPKLYTWSLIKGSDGMNGVPGTPGKDGITTYTWIKYADDASGSNMVDNPDGKDYLGLAHNKPTATESNLASDYTWSKVHGDQGIAGAPGKDGTTTYTWVKYADDATGTGITDNPAGKEYLGLAYNKTVPTESTVKGDYEWVKIHGDQGFPGAPGVDGITYYTWVKYADNAQGGGLTDDPENKKYIGLAYNKPVAAESTDPKLYTWALIKGTDGVNGVPGLPGKDGVTLYTWFKYANDEKGTGITDSPAGKDYIGIAYNKPTSAESMVPTDYTWSKVHGDQGIAGPAGNDGLTLYTWVKYADNDQGTGMTDNPANKEWLGLAYNKTSQTESGNYKDYGWTKIHGDQGVEGPVGPDGKTYYTWVKYADDATGKNLNDSPVGKTYIGLAYNRTTQQESTTASDYEWALFKGTDGTNGTNGTNGKPGVNGNDGLPGQPGAGFFRLSMTNFNNVWPSQATVDTAFRSEFGRDSERDDVLTIYNPADVKIAETRRKESTGAWVAAELLVHGDMILRGTIVADRIATGAISTDKLAAGAITADKIGANAITAEKIVANVSLRSPIIESGDIRSGRIEIGPAKNFVVENTGSFIAKNATLTGSITATNSTFSGTINGSVIQASSRIELGNNFSVNANGVMTCNGASINGTLRGTNGEFTGSLKGVTGDFKGSILAGSIMTGGEIKGGSIVVPATGTSLFSVSAAGNMTCNNATINGTLNNSAFNNGEVVGSAIYIPSKSSPKFSVATDGTTTIQSGSTGSRMVIKNDRIEVWDGTKLRVVLGRL